MKDPAVFVHVALALQPPLFVAHSLTSVHVVPLPVKPAAHAQLNVPSRFVQVACGSHGLLVHSLTSVQVTPLPE